MRGCESVQAVSAVEAAQELARRLAARTVHAPVTLVDAEVIRRLWVEEFHAGERAA